jgi:hypothetical protein
MQGQAVPENPEGATTMCSEPKAKVSRWGMIARSVGATLLAVGIWAGAIMAFQPTVQAPDLPLAQIGSVQWITTNAVEITASNWTVRIERGFITDLATIHPALQYRLKLKNDSPSIRRAALLHDALYALMDAEGHGPVDRATADALIELVAVQDGTVQKKATAVREAVSIWGWAAVASHTPETVAAAAKKISVKHIEP